MEKITITQKLDAVFEAIRNNVAPIKQGKLIAELSLLRHIPLTEMPLKAILVYLIEDGVILDLGDDTYFTSVKGRLFIETIGSYQAKALKDANVALLAQMEVNRRHTLDEHLKTSASRLNRLTRWLAIGTGALALIEIVKFAVWLFSPQSKP